MLNKIFRTVINTLKVNLVFNLNIGTLTCAAAMSLHQTNFPYHASIAIHFTLHVSIAT